MIKKLKICVLRALLAADDVPMPETALIGAVLILGRPQGPTDSDVAQAIRELSSEKLIQGVSAKFSETTWTLTTDGKHEARKL